MRQLFNKVAIHQLRLRHQKIYVKFRYIRYIKYITHEREKINKFIAYKLNQKNEKLQIINESDANITNKKILILFACHTNSEIKFNTLINNLQYFTNPNFDIVLINSTGLTQSEDLKKILIDKYIKYFEIDNDVGYDFGKWIYALKNIDYSIYNNVKFTNDSYIIDSNIDFFLNETLTTNVEFYGYNDSSECSYHYQSYLFSLKFSALQKFIDMYNYKIQFISSQNDLINQCELQMRNFFDTSDCYLKIAKFPIHREKNIFFTSDYLYNKLKLSGLLPFTKVKQIL